MGKSKITLQGKELENLTFKDKAIEYQFKQRNSQRNGAPIQYKDANRMVLDWWEQHGVGVNDDITEVKSINVALAFDKQLLMLVLAQDTCEGIRFYFCTRPDNGRQSLVAVGIDAEGKDLGYDLIRTVEDVDSAAGSIFQKITLANEAALEGEEATLLLEVGGSSGRP